MIWFPALLALIALACIFYTSRSSVPKPVGSARTTRQDQPYLWEYKTTGKRERPVYSRVCVPANPGFAFAIEREGFMHRAAKLFGFCQEFQTQRMDFDRKAYIQSDDTSFQRRIAGNMELQRHIVSAFQNGVRSIFTAPKYIVAEMKDTTPEPPAAAEAIVSDLYALAKMLEAAPAAPGFVPPMLRIVTRALPAIFISFSLISFSLALLMNYQLLDWPHFWQLEWQLSAAVIVVALVFIRVVFGNSSYGYPLLVHFLRYGSWSAAIASGSLLWFTNCAFDTHPAQIHDQTVSGKRVSQGRRSKSYYVYTHDWRSGGELSLRISSGLYHQLSAGSRIRVIAHSGAFGIEWVNSVERLTP